MTRPATVPAVVPPGTDTLTPRIFRALYSTFDLHIFGITYVAVASGTPWFSGHSLGDIAQQISQHEHPAPAQPPADATPPDSPPQLPRRPVTTPAQLARIGQLSDQWSFLWDKRRSLWIAAEDCPGGEHLEEANLDVLLARLSAIVAGRP